MPWKTSLRLTSIPFRICDNAYPLWQYERFPTTLAKKNWDKRAHVTQARDLSSMHAPMFGLRACLNFFGQGSRSSLHEDRAQRETACTSNKLAVSRVQTMYRAPFLHCDVFSTAGVRSCCRDWLHFLATMPFVSHSYLWFSYLPVWRTTLSLELVLPPVWNTQEKKERKSKCAKQSRHN